MNTATGADRKIAGVILAAGSASRMGTLKQLLMLQGKPMLAHVLGHARNARLAPLIVVLGDGAAKVQGLIDFTPDFVVFAKDFALGQSASLKAGLSRVPARCDGALFLLGDQPVVSSIVMDTLVDGFYRLGKDIVIPTYMGKRGNPVLIGRPLFPQLAALKGDTGARVLFQRYPESIAEIEVNDSGVCIDVDTWEDFRKLKEKEDT